MLEGKRDELPGLRRGLDVDDGSFAALREVEGDSPDPQRDLDDLAAVFHTLGTTGKPKGAVLGRAT